LLSHHFFLCYFVSIHTLVCVFFSPLCSDMFLRVNLNLLIELCLKDVWGCLKSLGGEMEWSRGTTFQSLRDPDVEVAPRKTHSDLCYQLPPRGSRWRWCEREPNQSVDEVRGGGGQIAIIKAPTARARRKYQAPLTAGVGLQHSEILDHGFNSITAV